MWAIVNDMEKDADLAAAIDILGTHQESYGAPDQMPPAGTIALKKPLWSTELHIGEIGSVAGAKDERTRSYDLPVWDLRAGLHLARALNRGYILANMTSTLIWTPTYSWYEYLAYAGKGLVVANTPWSGWYAVPDAVWMVAHTTQFVQPGWRFADRASCKLLSDVRGSVVSYISPAGKDISIVVETVQSNVSNTLQLQLTGELGSLPQLHMWRSERGAIFIEQAPLVLHGGAALLTIPPGIVLTLTTTTGQKKGGQDNTIPPRQNFTLPYSDNFDSVPEDRAPKYTSDMHGVFTASTQPALGGKVLQQQTTINPHSTHSSGYIYATIIGDASWLDYEVSIAARLLKTKAGAEAVKAQPGSESMKSLPKIPYLFLASHIGAYKQGSSCIIDGKQLPETCDEQPTKKPTPPSAGNMTCCPIGTAGLNPSVIHSSGTPNPAGFVFRVDFDAAGGNTATWQVSAGTTCGNGNTGCATLLVANGTLDWVLGDWMALKLSAKRQGNGNTELKWSVVGKQDSDESAPALIVHRALVDTIDEACGGVAFGNGLALSPHSQWDNLSVTPVAAQSKTDDGQTALVLRPMLLRNESLLQLTWSRLRAKDRQLVSAVARVEREARGHLHTGPFSVTFTDAVPPSGDKRDYVSIGVYWWPCARTSGLSPCNLTECVHQSCNCSSTEVCGKPGPHCNSRTGLPWQSCDGHENRKQIATGSLPQLAGLGAAVTALSSAFYWTRNATYASRAVLLLTTFFLDSETGMNPNLEFGQSYGFPCEPPACPAPGVASGSGSGLVEVDTILINCLESIALITHPAPCTLHGESAQCPGSTAWTTHHDTLMTTWLRGWTSWMKGSPFSTWACNYGKCRYFLDLSVLLSVADEKVSPSANNHNAACRSSWLAVSIWLGDTPMIAKLLTGAKEKQWTNDSKLGNMPYQKLGAADCHGCGAPCTGTCGLAPIGGQIDADGFLSQEAKRVNSIGYSTAELGNLFRLAQISRATGQGDLFEYTSSIGGHSSIRGALDYLVPFALGKQHWQHQTETTTFAIFEQLRAAAIVFGNRSYEAWADAIIAVPGADDNTSEAVLWWPRLKTDEDDTAIPSNVPTVNTQPPGRDVLSFDFGWRFFLGDPSALPPAPPPPPPDCSSDPDALFPVNVSGHLYALGGQTGLSAAANITTPEACAAACCGLYNVSSGPPCWLWNWNSAANWTQARCWVGMLTDPWKRIKSTGNSSSWIGAERATQREPTPVPGPPVLPDAPAAATADFNDSNWQLVDCPHDFLIGGDYDENAVPAGMSSAHPFSPRSGPPGGTGQDYKPRNVGCVSVSVVSDSFACDFVSRVVVIYVWC
eukprot:SAG22_NODE_333_length_12162_cov_11.415237_7_plen_1331_part_00